MQQRYYLKQNHVCIATVFRTCAIRRPNTKPCHRKWHGCKEIEWHSLNEIIITNNSTTVPFLPTTD